MAQSLLEFPVKFRRKEKEIRPGQNKYCGSIKIKNSRSREARPITGPADLKQRPLSAHPTQFDKPDQIYFFRFDWTAQAQVLLFRLFFNKEMNFHGCFNHLSVRISKLIKLLTKKKEQHAPSNIEELAPV